MKRWVVLLAIDVVAVLALAGGWWLMQENPGWREALAVRWESTLEALGLGAAGETEGLVASGFVEAREVLVTTARGGRIVALNADEGDEVEQGQVLAELDSALLLARIESAEADLGVAEAALALGKAGARQETLDHALARLEQARTAAEAARVAAQDARAMADDPGLELALLCQARERCWAPGQERWPPGSPAGQDCREAGSWRCGATVGDYSWALAPAGAGSEGTR